MRRLTRGVLAVLGALVLAVATAACGDGEEAPPPSEPAGGGAQEPIESSPENEGKQVTIGSKNFTEQFILGEIYSQALEAAGFDVTKELNLGSEQIAYRALKEGQVDAYPEYTGTSLTSFFDYDVEEVAGMDADEAYDATREEYEREGIVALPRGQFDNTYVVASTVEQKEELGNPETISDLAALPDAEQLQIAGFPECRQRQDCLLGLERVYDWTPEFVANEGKFEPLDNGETELGFVFGTDGQLTLTDQYAAYEDDQNLFPPYHISLGVREDALEEIGPEGEEVLLRVQEPLTDEVMRELNSRVDLDKQEPEEVAAQYLREEGFVQ
jgi:glycine betaine/choline ABC-type transport system substrate-binding protein